MAKPATPFLEAPAGGTVELGKVCLLHTDLLPEKRRRGQGVRKGQQWGLGGASLRCIGRKKGRWWQQDRGVQMVAYAMVISAVLT